MTKGKLGAVFILFVFVFCRSGTKAIQVEQFRAKGVIGTQKWAEILVMARTYCVRILKVNIQTCS